MKIKKRRVFARTLGDIALPAALFLTESVVTVVLSRTTTLLTHIAVPDVALTLIGSAIGVLLAFRTNAAYARWWEARTLWGAVTNGARSLTRQIVATTADARASRYAEDVAPMLIAFVRSLHGQLAGGDARMMLAERNLPAPAAPGNGNVAAALLVDLGRRTGSAHRAAELSDVAALRIDATLSELAGAQGGAERIASTPMPRPFDLFPQLFVYVYAALLPLVLVDELGLAMPFVALVVSSAFLIVNRIGTDLEAPFAATPYRIPTQTLCDGIEDFVRTQTEWAAHTGVTPV